MTRDVSLADSITIFDIVYLSILAFWLALALTVICVAWIAIIHWMDSRKWRRLVRAHGGDEAAAWATVLMLEADFENRLMQSWRHSSRTTTNET